MRSKHLLAPAIILTLLAVVVANVGPYGGEPSIAPH
jgi:hypothetical protein